MRRPVSANGRRTAGDVMTTPVITIDKDTDIAEAARTLSENRISGALVVDYGSRPIGVVSLFDVAAYLAGLERPLNEPGGFYRYSYPRFEDEEGGEGWEGELEEEAQEALKEIPVGEIMSPRIISVSERLPLMQVARMLLRHRIHRAFVSRNGKPVGVITMTDVLRALSTGSGTRRPAVRH